MLPGSATDTVYVGCWLGLYVAVGLDVFMADWRFLLCMLELVTMLPCFAVGSDGFLSFLPWD